MHLSKLLYECVVDKLTKIYFWEVFVQNIWTQMYSKYYYKRQCPVFSTPWPGQPSREGGDRTTPPLRTGSACQGTGKGGCIVAKPHYMLSFKGEGGKWQSKGVVCNSKGKFGSFPVWVFSKSGYLSSVEQKGKIWSTPSRTKMTFHPTSVVCHLFQKLFQRN